MRNLVQYPITGDEIVDYLRSLAADVDPEKTRLVGDMRPLLLDEAIRAVRHCYGVRSAEPTNFEEIAEMRGWSK